MLSECFNVSLLKCIVTRIEVIQLPKGCARLEEGVETGIIRGLQEGPIFRAASTESCLDCLHDLHLVGLDIKLSSGDRELPNGVRFHSKEVNSGFVWQPSQQY